MLAAHHPDDCQHTLSIANLISLAICTIAIILGLSSGLAYAADTGSKIEYVEAFDLSQGYDAPGTLTVTTTYFGQEAQRLEARLNTDGADALADLFLNFYADIFGDIEVLQPLSIASDETQPSITFTEYYQLTLPWVAGEDIAEDGYNFYFYESMITQYLGYDSSHSKSIELMHPLDITASYTVKLKPQEWSFNDTKKQVNNAWFNYQYRETFNPQQNLLTVTHDYHQKTALITAQQSGRYQKALEKVDQYNSYGIVDYPSNDSQQSVATTTSTDSSVTPDEALLTDDAAELSKFENDILEFQKWLMIAMLALLLVIYAVVNLLIEPKSQHDSQFYPVSMAKFVVLTLATLGLYPNYWCYKNWQFIAQRDRPDIWPKLRAVFNIIWLYPLYTWLEIDNDMRNNKRPILAKGLFLVLFVFFVASLFMDRIYQNYLLQLGILAAVFLPLVAYINRINGKSSTAFKTHSRWQPRNIIICIIGLPIVLWTTGQDIHLLASNDIVKGEKLWQHDIDFIKRHELIPTNDEPILFYSADMWNNQKDGNGFSQTHVFSYWIEDNQLQSQTTALSNVVDIDVTYSESMLEDTDVTVTFGEDEQEMLLYLPNKDEQDLHFIKQLKLAWTHQVKLAEKHKLQDEQTEKLIDDSSD